MSVNFNDLLSTQVDQAERPKPLPPGTYTFIIQGQPKFDRTKSDKETPFIEWQATPVQAHGDVDQTLLSQVKDWNKRGLRLTFYLTEDAKFRLREFMEKLGLSVQGRTFAEVLPEVVNQQFVAAVKHEVAQKSGNIFAVIDDNSVAAA